MSCCVDDPTGKHSRSAPREGLPGGKASTDELVKQYVSCHSMLYVLIGMAMGTGYWESCFVISSMG